MVDWQKELESECIREWTDSSPLDGWPLLAARRFLSVVVDVGNDGSLGYRGRVRKLRDMVEELRDDELVSRAEFGNIVSTVSFGLAAKGRLGLAIQLNMGVMEGRIVSTGLWGVIKRVLHAIIIPPLLLFTIGLLLLEYVQKHLWPRLWRRARPLD